MSEPSGWYSIGASYYVGKDYEKGIDVFASIIEAFPESEWSDRSRTRMARCYHGLGRIEESVAIYKEYADRHPDSAGAANSFAWFCASRKIGLYAALPVALRGVELSNRDAGREVPEGKSGGEEGRIVMA